jgi:hypothetical protein
MRSSGQEERNMQKFRVLLTSLVLIGSLAGCISIHRDEGPEHHGWQYDHED